MDRRQCHTNGRGEGGELVAMTEISELPAPSAEIIAVQDDLVTIAPTGERPLMKNEVVYIIPHGPERAGQRREYLRAEVLRVRGATAASRVGSVVALPAEVAEKHMSAWV